MSARKTELLKVLKYFNSSVSFSRKYTVRYVSNIDPLPTRYGGKTNITILPGVGIGPEIMSVTLSILKAARAPLTYEILSLSPTETSDEPEAFQAVLKSIRRNRVALKGNIEIKSKDPHAASRNVLLRRSLDLFVYVLHCKTYPALRNKFGEIDVIIVRQNTEGEYLMLEHEPTPGKVESLKIVTRHASERLARFAFGFALKHQRKKITVVHSADVLTRSEGLFLEGAVKVSKDFPQINLEVTEIGVCASSLLINPGLYDIILTTNLNGSMISNLLTGMVGGPGLSAGTNLGGGGLAVFEPGVRNKGSSIVGKGIANPFAMLKAAINLLNYLGYHETSKIIKQAMYQTLVHDKIVTPDLGGKATTEQVANRVIQHVNNQFFQKIPARKRQKSDSWKSYCPMPDEPEKDKKS